MKSSRDTLKKLQKFTGWDLVELKPFPDLPRKERTEKLKETIYYAFSQIDNVLEYKKQRKKLRIRRFFRCCELLKENPGREYCKSIPKNEREKHLFFLSIAAYESQLRSGRMEFYRKNNYWVYPYQNMGGVHYARPYIFLREGIKVTQELERLGWDGVRSSGCSLCPQLLVYKEYLMKKDYKSFARSSRYFREHFQNLKFCGQLIKPLDEFIEVSTIDA